LLQKSSLGSDLQQRRNRTVIFFAIGSNRCHHDSNVEHLQEVIVSISIRTLLVPGVAFATAGAVALGPVMVAPPAVTLAQPVVALPVVTIPDVQLAGFTLDLYNALNGWAQFGVEVAQDLFFWNPSIATAIGSLYTTFEPIVTQLVTFIDIVVQGPAAIISSLTTLVSNVFGIDLSGITGLFGLTAASVGKASIPRAAAARTAKGPRAAASVVELPVAADVTADITADVTADISADVIAAAPAPARASRGEARRAAKPAAVGARQAARAAAAQAPAVTQNATGSDASADRGSARATRGSVAKAARQDRAGVTVASDSAS